MYYTVQYESRKSSKIVHSNEPQDGAVSTKAPDYRAGGLSAERYLECDFLVKAATLSNQKLKKLMQRNQPGLSER